MEEIWKPVEGFEGCYEVSNTGRVRSLDREVILHGKREGEKRIYKGRELSPLNVHDHMNIHLLRGGVRTSVSLGKLVAIHFLDGFKESGRNQVRHKDGNPANCSVDNLFFVPVDNDGNVEED